MTEEDAKTKWCPFVRFVSVNNRGESETSIPRNPPITACIGSACMAWRWKNDYERRWDLPKDKPPEGEGWQRVEAIGGVAHWVRQHATPHGFCGLAGAPQ